MGSEKDGGASALSSPPLRRILERGCILPARESSESLEAAGGSLPSMLLASPNWSKHVTKDD